MIQKVHPGSGSRIRILIFTHPGSQSHIRNTAYIAQQNIGVENRSLQKFSWEMVSRTFGRPPSPPPRQ
jgi:hypothetical protein